MKPPAFDYHCPSSLEEALALLHALGAEAKPLAGGQSLAPMLNCRLARPAHLVDLNRIPALAYIRREAGTLRSVEASPNYPKSHMKEGLRLKDFVLAECDELEIARQLTILDFARFKQIQPRECLNQVPPL